MFSVAPASETAAPPRVSERSPRSKPVTGRTKVIVTELTGVAVVPGDEAITVGDASVSAIAVERGAPVAVPSSGRTVRVAAAPVAGAV